MTKMCVFIARIMETALRNRGGGKKTQCELHANLVGVWLICDEANINLLSGFGLKDSLSDRH